MTNYVSNIETSDGNRAIGGKAFDGQFIQTGVTLANNLSMAASATKTISLADYIPNDGYDYEMTYMIVANTGTTSGNTANIEIYSGNSTSGFKNVPIYCNTRSSSTENNTRTSYLPISHSNRNIYVKNAGQAITGLYIYAKGYRRIGTNGNNDNPTSNICLKSEAPIPNAIVWGNPTITGGVVSNFSANNYLDVLNGKQDNNAEYVVKFTTGSATSTEVQSIMTAETFFTLEMIANSWDVYTYNWETSESITLFTTTANTTYWVKIVINDKTKTYYYTTDGTTYTQVANFTDNNMDGTLVFPLRFGNHSNSQFLAKRIFLGSIDLNETYINVDGERFWNGMDYKKYCQIGGDNFDGQWDSSAATLLSSVSVAASGNKDVSIVSYLNDTSHDYEILVTGWGSTGSTSGNSCRIKVMNGTTGGTDFYLFGGITRTASARNFGGLVMVPIYTGSQVVRIQNTGSAASTVTLYVRGKRRIGLNNDNNSYLQKINSCWAGGNNFDGQWVQTDTTLASYSSLAATTSYNVNLSSYLPNDGEAYEILLRTSMNTSATNGQYSEVYVNGAGQLLMTVRQNTRTASNHGDSCTVIVPISRGNRTLVIRNGSSNASGSVSIYGYGYRRLGTNT